MFMQQVNHGKIRQLSFPGNFPLSTVILFLTRIIRGSYFLYTHAAPHDLSRLQEKME